MLNSRDEVALSEEAHLWSFKFSKTCNAAETFFNYYCYTLLETKSNK